MQIQSKYDIVIIGGGVYGLSIAYYLSKNQNLKVAVLQQYAIGHNKGSSHSTTRITRSLYEKEVYRDLNLECLAKNWPEIQSTLKEKFIHSNEFVYFDDNNQTYANFRKVAEQTPKQNVVICQTQDDYTNYFKGRKAPLIQSKYPPIIDKKAGVIYASLYIKKLQQYLANSCDNVTLIEHTSVKSINENEKQLSIQTQTDILRANKVVLACGKWIKQMCPQITDLLRPVKQFVSFLQLEHEFNFTVGKYPSFVHQQKNGKIFYSVPGDNTQKLGVKLSEHRSHEHENPDAVENSPEHNYQQLRKKALEYFGEDLIRVKNIEECVYTVTQSNDFIIDWVGESEKILVCSCCSGHGFKFSPIIGEIISCKISSSSSEEQKSSCRQKQNQTFRRWQHMFKIAYHRGVNLQ